MKPWKDTEEVYVLEVKEASVRSLDLPDSNHQTFITGNDGVSNTDSVVTRSWGTGRMSDSWVRALLGWWSHSCVVMAPVNLTEWQWCACVGSEQQTELSGVVARGLRMRFNTTDINLFWERLVHVWGQGAYGKSVHPSLLSRNLQALWKIIKFVY